MGWRFAAILWQSDLGWQSFVLALNFGSALVTILVNKLVFGVFPYPGTVTFLHYLTSWAGVVTLRRSGAFEPRKVETEKRAFYCLLVVWSLCNTFSNGSLEKNSVSFYQMAKISVTPVVVLIDRVAYGKRIGYQQSFALAAMCVGIALATVTDVSITARGCAMATLSVGTGIATKILVSHMQQHGGLNSLQLMDVSFPFLTAISIITIPFMDSWELLSGHWCTVTNVTFIFSSAVAAFFINYSSTLVLRVTSALAHTLLGQLKTSVVLLTGIWLFDKPPSGVTIFGASVAVLSLALYAGLGLDRVQFKTLHACGSVTWRWFNRRARNKLTFFEEIEV
eukprot:TRINITY_DN65380_c0_g1_i1.p1 TRINITY_DN65380_c0_g1~~TRINITY_DN65380_c0_g1_i1.p1  ORF type:complete len:337 (+),score=44.08 TRINITY_DN65380_c0_g1_i1:129-1139(+)